MISHDNLTWTARICAELYCVNNVRKYIVMVLCCKVLTLCACTCVLYVFTVCVYVPVYVCAAVMMTVSYQTFSSQFGI